MPAAQLIAVVALRGLPGGRSEVAEVAAGPTGQVVVVARGRAGAALVAAPGRVIAVGELAGRAGVVDIVAEGGDGAGQPVEQLGGGLIATGGTPGDIPRGQQRGGCPGGRRRVGSGSASVAPGSDSAPGRGRLGRVGGPVGVGLGRGAVAGAEGETSCGLLAPSRESKMAPSLDCGSRTKPTAPLPFTALVTSYSTQVPLASAPLSSSTPPFGPGRLLQVMPVSLQPVPVALHGRTVLGDRRCRCTHSRSVALCTVPLTPLTSKRR